ncbi:MAG: hypothetical protein L0332_31345 [Chloroflexi bacterium]|nr:hypothetical protein [Chloroflexota bacterium]MCI0574857.1 hypothetical protein [Chloroflexota bacterium]MCI0650113.1 hypothetical protein [Chloroflexota bacterium]MCI0731197.1 hypothetical protein [Chloroflexota bacterium]
MRIQFYEDGVPSPRPPEEVRFNQLGLYVYPGGRQVAIGFDVTPFLERPSIEVTVTNDDGRVAATLTVVEAMQPNFNLTMHLRDQEPTGLYHVEAVLYYPAPGSAPGERHTPGSGRMVVDSISKSFNATQVGEQ